MYRTGRRLRRGLHPVSLLGPFCSSRSSPAAERWRWHRNHGAAALRAASAISSHLERRGEVTGPVAACGRDGELLAAEADLDAAESLALLRVQAVAVDQDWAAGQRSARRRDAIHELDAALQLVGYVGGQPRPPHEVMR